MGCGPSIQNDTITAKKNISQSQPYNRSAGIRTQSTNQGTRRTSRVHLDVRGIEEDESELSEEEDIGVKQNDKKTTNKKTLARRETFRSIHQLLHGNPQAECRSDARVVRIFTSSTFTDTKYERNALIERAYPKLKSFCQENSYEFQVVDMRWGVREEAADDHKTTELCLKEIKLCQEISTGPNFVTFLSQKYGYRPFDRLIEAEEFDTITADVTDEENDIIERWFFLDKNSIPPQYVLQPISHVYPDYWSQDDNLYKKAKDKFNEDFDVIKNVLTKGAKNYLETAEEIRKYLMSVTEQEILHGILRARDPHKHCIWFKRTFENIEKVPPTKDLSRYYECMGKEEDIKEAKELLKDLKEKQIPEKLPSTSVVEYKVKWENKGIDPDNKDHKRYLDQIVEDFETRMKILIKDGIQERKDTYIGLPIYREVNQHVKFCRHKCEMFHGREETLKNIQTYVLSNSDLPLIIYGDSGSGKTSLVAVAASEAWTWLNGNGAIVYRFIGTTQDSSTLRRMLTSIVSQIWYVYDKRGKPRQELKYLVEDFKESFYLASSQKPLLVLLDSLDQLDVIDGGRQLHWLPRKLPPNVKLLLTTLPQERYGCFQRCKNLYPDKKCYLEIPKLSKDDVSDILKKWLDKTGRKLTKSQNIGVLAAFQHVPLPLFLKLSFDEATRWHSYDPPDKTPLYVAIPDMIKALFMRLERSHGKVLVWYALGYLTASQSGLTETELEDLLSLSDDVLNDVYQYWTPPMRRLPPLLWVRMRQDVEEYIVLRGVDSVQVVRWYHRQFIEAAEKRYILSHEAYAKKFHLELAEYFMGTYAEKPKPYKDKNGKEKSAMRYVAKQPLMFDEDDFNLRKLNQLPYHLIKAGQLELLKKHCLCNYEFLLTKLRTTSIRAVLSDFMQARIAFPTDRDLHAVMETFQLSQGALENAPEELPGQLYGRIYRVLDQSSDPVLSEGRELLKKGMIRPEFAEVAEPLIRILESMEDFIKEKYEIILNMLQSAKNTSIPCLMPHCGFLIPPGGQLLHNLGGHVDTVSDIDFSRDGKRIATGSHDKILKLWDRFTGNMLQAVDMQDKISSVQFCHGGEWVAVSCLQNLTFILDVGTGTTLQEWTKNTSDSPRMEVEIALCQHKGKEYLVRLRNKEVDILDVVSGKTVNTKKIELHDWSTENQGLAPGKRELVASNQYAVFAGYCGHEFFVLDLGNGAAMTTVPVFEKYEFQKIKMYDFATGDHPHISALEIIPNNMQVVVCDGASQSLHFYNLKGQCIRTVPGPSGDNMQCFYTRSDGNFIYYASHSSVGIWDLEGDSRVRLLNHPCKVTKVMSINDSTIVSLGEDNILRIWDKSLQPFRPDVSSFTGKVNASKNFTNEFFQNSLDSLFLQATDGQSVAPKVEEHITGDMISHYWVRDSSLGEKAFDILSRFLVMGNPRYLCVCQDTKAHDVTTVCFSIWDITTIKCVRRIIFDFGKVYAGCLVENTQLAIIENQKLKILDAKKEWKASKTFKGKVSMVGKPIVIFIKGRNEILTRSSGGRYLKLMSIESGEMTGCLMPCDQSKFEGYLKTVQIKMDYIQDVQVTSNGKVVLGLYQQNHQVADTMIKVYIWNLDTQTVMKVVDCGVHGPLFSGPLQVITNGNKEMLVSPWLQQGGHYVYDAEKGTFGDRSIENKISELEGLNLSVTLREGQTSRYIQMNAVYEDGSDTVITEADIGPHATNFVTSEDKMKCVTWCAEPKEKAVKYWGYQYGKYQLLGTFTPDGNVSNIHLADNGRSILIDSNVGVVRLQMYGRDIPELKSPHDDSPIIFEGLDLNIPFEQEDCEEDPADLDIDTAGDLVQIDPAKAEQFRAKFFK